MTSRLAVRRAVLADLTPDQLCGVAGGASGVLCPTQECTGYYPTFGDCVGDLPTVRDCVYWPRTDLCE